MKPVAFEYCRPDTAAEAVELLDEFGFEASVLAGGMTLGPMLNMRLVRPRAVIDISRVAELAGLEIAGDRLVTGATLGQADALAAPEIGREIPLLAQVLPHVGHFQTRNRGTLGGSVAHGDPAAEIPLALVTLGGAVHLRDRKGERRVPAREFFRGALETARRHEELLVALEWPRARACESVAFEEFAERHGDFAIAAAACRLSRDASGEIASLDLGLGGVESRPLAMTLEAPRGAAASIEGIVEAALDGVVAMADRTASAAYRRDLAAVLIRRVLARAMAPAIEAAP